MALSVETRGVRIQAFRVRVKLSQAIPHGGPKSKSKSKRWKNLDFKSPHFRIMGHFSCLKNLIRTPKPKIKMKQRLRPVSYLLLTFVFVFGPP